MATHQKIKVLVVDDSATIRGLLTSVLQSDEDIEVTGSVGNGASALDWLKRHTADVVILDVEMPIMDGIETLSNLQKSYPDLPVVMASGLTSQGTKTAVRALAMGAAACVAKPQGASMKQAVTSLSEELLPLLKALCQKETGRTRPASSLRNAKSPQSNLDRIAAAHEKKVRRKNTPVDIIAIGSSTGGPNALTTFLKQLPEAVQQPIVIVQHMPPAFTPMLAKNLQSDCGRPTHEVEHGTPIQRGHVYVAPGDFHMEIKKTAQSMILELNQKPREHYCRPSVNPLFRSVANCYGARSVAVMLTGMGEDGIEGTGDIVSEGGYVIAQDEATSVVWGMPGAVAQHNYADEILPLTKIAHAVARICQQERQFV